MKDLRVLLRIATTAFAVASVVYAVRTRRPAGRFLNVPYEFRMPTVKRLRGRLWNPNDDRVVTPCVFGLGWSVNLYQVLQQLREYRPTDSQDLPDIL